MASITVFGQTTWTLDPNHSKLGFTVTHLGIADIPGHFNDYTVEITTSKEDFSDAVVELTVQTSSVDTRISARDEHLRSPDFFNVENSLP